MENTVAKRPTIYDVAERAGVSKSLVSLVLQGSPRVRADKRTAVLEAVAELGYSPSRLAAGLAGSRTRSVGVVIDEFENLWFAPVLAGIRAALAAERYSVSVADVALNSHLDLDPLEAFRALRVDGVILAGEASRATLAQLGVPVVILGTREVSAPDVPVVASDEFAGGRLAAAHLADLGHRDMVCVSAPGASAAARTAGFAAELRERGLPLRIVRAEHTSGAAAGAAITGVLDPQGGLDPRGAGNAAAAASAGSAAATVTAVQEGAAAVEVLAAASGDSAQAAVTAAAEGAAAVEGADVTSTDPLEAFAAAGPVGLAAAAESVGSVGFVDLATAAVPVDPAPAPAGAEGRTTAVSRPDPDPDSDLDDPGPAAVVPGDPGAVASQLVSRPTAIFAVNDPMALGVMGVAARLGLSVSGELSVMGYDDSPLAEYELVSLTSVSSDPRELGEAAGRALLAILGGEQAPSETLLDPRVVVRGSTARV